MEAGRLNSAQLQVENAALEQFRLQQQVEMGALEEFRRLNGSSPDGAANGAKAFSTGLTTSSSSTALSRQGLEGGEQTRPRRRCRLHPPCFSHRHSRHRRRICRCHRAVLRRRRQSIVRRHGRRSRR